MKIKITQKGTMIMDYVEKFITAILRDIMYLIRKLLSNIKEFCYKKLNWKKRCICGGRIITRYHYHSRDDVGWEIECLKCQYLYAEE